MESAVVNARIPLAKKEAASGMLKSIGATPSELINSAYDYLLRYGELPKSQGKDIKHVSGFADFVQATTFDVDWDPADLQDDYKQILRNGKLADYESLA